MSRCERLQYEEKPTLPKTMIRKPSVIEDLPRDAKTKARFGISERRFSQKVDVRHAPGRCRRILTEKTCPHKFSPMDAPINQKPRKSFFLL